MEQVEARLADYGLLAVAKDGADPDSCKALIDYDLSAYPELPPAHPHYLRNLETRMRYNQHNASNYQKRRSLRFAAWTKVYTLFKASTETSAPVFSRELLEKCSFEKLHGMSDGYFDGPRAYGLVSRKVFGATRTKADKNFYRTAERLQTSNRLPDGASADEYSKKALAFLVKIQPYLAQPYDADDTSEYLVDLMPHALRESGRRVKDKLITDGVWHNHMQVLLTCRELVREEQKGGTQTPVMISISSDDLSNHDFGKMQQTTGMALAAPFITDGANGRGGGGGLAGAAAAGNDNWGPCCPHAPGITCFLKPSYAGPLPVSVFVDKERTAGIKAAKAANARKHGLPNAQLRDPPKAKVDAYVKRMKDRKAGRGTGGDKAGKDGATPGGVAVPDADDWREGLLDVYAVALPEEFHIAAMAMADGDSPEPLVDAEDCEDDEEDLGGAPPQFWYVMVPMSGAMPPELLCLPDPSFLEYDATTQSPIEFGDDKAAAQAHFATLAIPRTPNVKPAEQAALTLAGLDTGAESSAPALTHSTSRLVHFGESTVNAKTEARAPVQSKALTMVTKSGDVPPTSLEPDGATTRAAPAAPAVRTPVSGAATFVAPAPATARLSVNAQAGSNEPPPTPLLDEPKPRSMTAPFGGCGPDCKDHLCDVAVEDEPSPVVYKPFLGEARPKPPTPWPPTPRVATHVPNLGVGTPHVARSARDRAAGIALAAGLLVAAMLYFRVGLHKDWSLGTGFVVAGFHVYALDNGVYDRFTVEEARRVVQLICARVAADDVQRGIRRARDAVTRAVSAMITLLRAHFTFFMFAAGAFFFLHAVAAFEVPATQGGVGSAMGSAICSNRSTAPITPSDGPFWMDGKWMGSTPIAPPLLMDELMIDMSHLDECSAELDIYHEPPPSPPPSPPPLTTLSDDEVPRADYLSHAQAKQLRLELLAGCEVPENLPRSITHTIAIADTGCARSMANHEDHFRPGTIVERESNVSGVSGGFKTKQQGDVCWPMETDHHGFRCWDEPGGIVNKACAYVLLALGRMSHMRGLSLVMPSWGKDPQMVFPNGVTVTLHNRDVLVLRPFGYKAGPEKALAAPLQQTFYELEGDFIIYLGSGPEREGDVTSQCKELGLNATIVLIDPVIGGPSHDATRPEFLAMSMGAVAPSAKRRCLGLLVSLRCKTWSAANFLPDANGLPGKPWRDCDNLLGIKVNGILPREVVESNAECTNAARLSREVARNGGFVIAETPGRRVGPRAVPRHVLSSCTRAVNMFDHPDWAEFAVEHGASEHVWDQCTKADDPKASPVKTTIWLCTPNISSFIVAEFGHPPDSLCNHPAGTHKALRGVDASGTYLTKASKSENYSAGTNRSVARSFVAFKASLDRFNASEAAGVAGVVQGKTLSRGAITHQFIHDSFNHAEARVLKLLPKALSDATDQWAEVIADGPCEACLRGNAPLLGPTGTLPTDEGLIFLDLHHVTVPELFTGFTITLGMTHAASGFAKSVRIGNKSQAHEAIELCLCYLNSVGRPCTWIHTDNAWELMGTKVIVMARGKNIRVTTTTVKSSRKNRQEPQWRAQFAVVRKLLVGLPFSLWGWASDHAEEGRALLPSRDAPHDCALGRLLSKGGVVVKPPGGFRRPFMCLGYVTEAPRLPSGTLVNKLAPMAKRALCVGYVGGRSG
ncbi:hypothetical protein OAO87_02565, partial [bacterium]|nr:hypothetical protein [bacterium]